MSIDNSTPLAGSRPVEDTDVLARIRVLEQALAAAQAPKQVGPSLAARLSAYRKWIVSVIGALLIVADAVIAQVGPTALPASWSRWIISGIAIVTSLLVRQVPNAKVAAAEGDAG